MVGCSVNTVLERMWKDAVLADSGIYLNGLRKKS